MVLEVMSKTGAGYRYDRWRPGSTRSLDRAITMVRERPVSANRNAAMFSSSTYRKTLLVASRRRTLAQCFG